MYFMIDWSFTQSTAENLTSVDSRVSLDFLIENVKYIFIFMY